MSGERKDEVKGEIAFNNNGTEIQFRFDSRDQAIWASAQNIADLFGIGVATIRQQS